ncbi:interferon-induced very large GTPase 1-like isoform X6 [Palaemon carinicauda]|uniref:interferon-induced very large GTPase 1-like isoform X6 n=1 Tax=Palaemon carinicauda TaxID=392227 RepID=UPI0035B5EEF0
MEFDRVAKGDSGTLDLLDEKNGKLTENPGDVGKDRPIPEKMEFDRVAEGDSGTLDVLDDKHGKLTENPGDVGQDLPLPEKTEFDRVAKGKLTENPGDVGQDRPIPEKMEFDCVAEGDSGTLDLLDEKNGKLTENPSNVEQDLLLAEKTEFDRVAEGDSGTLDLLDEKNGKLTENPSNVEQDLLLAEKTEFDRVAEGDSGTLDLLDEKNGKLTENPGNVGQDLPLPEKTEFDRVAEGDSGTMDVIDKKHGELYENPGDVGQAWPVPEKMEFGRVAEGDSGTMDVLNQKHGEKELLEILGLSSYFPGKISLETVNKKASQKLDSTNDIPWYVLYKLLMLDYRGRDTIISPNIKTQLGNVSRDQHIQSEDDLESLFTEVTEEFSMNVSYAPHPTDVLSIILRCSSDFVKQIICEKLFLCKLAIPLILPSFLKQLPKIFLWPLRTIATEKYSGNEGCHLVSMLKQSTPVISWLRLGEISISKSRLLNEILNDQSHPTFFHRDCENGMNKRSVSAGSLEIAWQLFKLQNDGSAKVNSNKIILNLRGNGKDCEGTTRFLFEVSNVVIVMVDIQHLQNSYLSQFLEPMSKYGSVLIILFTKPPSLHIGSEEKVKIRGFIDLLHKWNFTKERIIFDFEGARAKNIKALKEEIELKLQLCLKGASLKGVGEVFKETTKSLNITVDEEDSKCINVRTKAECLRRFINEQEADTLKTKNLPMQCNPWKKWANLNKEEHRQKRKGESTVDVYANKIYLEKQCEREKQLKYLKNPTKVFKVFMNDLDSLSKEQRIYYLKWLKIYLDDLSRERLPDQQRKFNQLWRIVSQMEDGIARNRTQTLNFSLKQQLHLKYSEEELANASFGLEHFLREVAQAYESVSSLRCDSNNIKQKINCFPRIMAELMLKGFPLELMDGDAAHVPIVWVDAVLQQLKEIIGNKKMFVLSVLGVQSSGKSTLLNAMFGLQFSVAAGRCTRGVYAQLLHLPEEFSSDDYEYLLVVDTEGLRACELGEEKVQHDNEIATFVIGIGDMTLVNIKGENVTEIEDVLQIVIHALLKMKLVNKRLALQPSCFFIHQNVPGSDAAQNLKFGQLKFMETLNRVTEAAGKQEDAPGITRFRQLINFDYTKNVFYFPDLWKGDPPVAPVNPGYSEGVSRVREMLLKDIIPRRAVKVSIQEFSVKLKDLWNGILDQDFVFNFRNGLEIEAYSTLESVLSELQWSLKNAAMKWLNTKKIFVANCDYVTDSMEGTHASELRSHLGEELAKVKSKLEKHFESGYAVVLEQWRTSSFIKLQECYDDIINRTIKSLKDELRRKTVQVDCMRDVKKYKFLIINEAKMWANEIKKDQVNSFLEEDEMKYYFKKKWTEWMKKIDCIREDGDDDIEIKTTKVLHASFPEDLVFVRGALKDKRFMSVKLIQQKLSEIVDENVIDTWVSRFIPPGQKALSKSRWVPNKVTGYIAKRTRDTPKNKVKTMLVDKISSITSLVSNVVGPIGRRDIEFILEKTDEIINEIKISGIGLRDVVAFKICIALCFYQYFCREYDHIHKLRRVKVDEVKEENRRDEMVKFLLNWHFPQATDFIEKCLRQMTVKPGVPGVTMNDIVIDRKDVDGLAVVHEAEKRMLELLREVELRITTAEVQSFKEEYVEEIIRIVKQYAMIDKGIKFNKPFVVELAVHMCNIALPVFEKNHKKYKDNLNPVFYLEEYYDTFYEVFHSSVSKVSDEKALAKILSERMSQAIQSSIGRDIHRELADDVRNNVPQVKLKSALLKAILNKLLDEDNFQEFILYLGNFNDCLRKWVSYFINEYLFLQGANGTRYKQIIHKEVQILLSKICENVMEVCSEIVEGDHDTQKPLNLWAEEFHAKVSDTVPIPLEDILNLVEGYQIFSLESFKEVLCDFLRKSIEKYDSIYGNHSHIQIQDSDGPTIYDIILEECAGCTETCPFCHSPCTLNSANHTAQEIKHMAMEHYPQACGKYSSVRTRKLVTRNCTTLVASNGSFQCKVTNYKSHPYKNYHEIFPDWKIHGDISVEATPYWKWFLVKYESRLAKRYHAQRPDIPESWREITKEMARESLNK